MKDKISIIIVNWNGKRWLKKCLDSLISQSYKNIEIIVVDNKSTDNSVEYIKQRYPNVIIIKSFKNLGFAGGNNLGIQKASGDFILMMNNDTWVKPNFVEKIINFYKKNRFDVVAPYSRDYFRKKNFTPYIFKIDLLGHNVVYRKKEISSGFYLSGVCLFFKKNFYQKTRGLDNNFFMYCEEADWFWRLNLLKKSFSFVPNLFIYHYIGGSTGKKINYKLFLWRNQNTLQMLLKNYAWYSLAWVLPIYIIQNIFEIIFFLLILRPKIAFSYIEGWIFNMSNIRKILRRRSWVQKNRLVGDWCIIQKMYFGLGKAIHIVRRFGFLK